MSRLATSPGEAHYLFDPESVRPSNQPSEDDTRLIWMFLRLLRFREIDYASFSKEFRRGEKTFGRDVAKLRAIGIDYGFTIGRQKRSRVQLLAATNFPDPRKHVGEVTDDTLRAVADALGEIVANDIYAATDASSTPSDPFLRLAMPRLFAHSTVATTYGRLRDAWRSRARVRFRYPQSKRPDRLEERIVEPHLVTYYDGRYYLVAYDARPRTAGWRQFALDRIVDPIAPFGTFVRRSIPRAYRGIDAIGLFKTMKPIEVSIAISPEIAASVLARRWQQHQQISRPELSWPIVTFSVCDIGEAVRWAFGFGAYARVVAPIDAVNYARSLAASLVASHEIGVRRQA